MIILYILGGGVQYFVHPGAGKEARGPLYGLCAKAVAELGGIRLFGGIQDAGVVRRL